MDDADQTAAFHHRVGQQAQAVQPICIESLQVLFQPTCLLPCDRTIGDLFVKQVIRTTNLLQSRVAERKVCSPVVTVGQGL